MANKPSWLANNEKLSSIILEGKSKSEDNYRLKMLLKIVDKHKHNSLPTSNYDLERIQGNKKERTKYLKKMVNNKWIKWIDDTEPKKSGWIPEPRGILVVKTLYQLQNEIKGSNPLLDLKAFQDIDYIDKSLFS